MEEVFGKMLEMNHKMFDEARKNIHKAQERYKKNYDIKRNKSEVFNMHEVDCIIMCVYNKFFFGITTIYHLELQKERRQVQREVGRFLYYT